MKGNMTRGQKRFFIKAVLAGNRSEAKKILTQGIEYPLFWEKQDNHYVSGPYNLTEDEFRELQKTKPCFIG